MFVPGLPLKVVVAFVGSKLDAWLDNIWLEGQLRMRYSLRPAMTIALHLYTREGKDFVAAVVDSIVVERE